MKVKSLKLTAVVAAFVFCSGMGSVAHAQWGNSFEDLGVTYVIWDTTVGLNTTHTYTMMLDTSGYNQHAAPSFLDSINLKAWDGKKGLSATLISAPNGTGDWSQTFGSISNGGGSGCGGSNSGFVCFESVSKGVFAVDGDFNGADWGNYTFEFSVTLADANKFFTKPEGGHVGAGYADATGNGSSYGITSVAMVPEPEIYAMMGVGLGLLGWVRRRKRLKEAALA